LPGQRLHQRARGDRGRAESSPSCTADKQYATILTDTCRRRRAYQTPAATVPARRIAMPDIPAQGRDLCRYPEQTRSKGEISSLPANHPVSMSLGWQGNQGAASGASTDCAPDHPVFDSVGFAVEDFMRLLRINRDADCKARLLPGHDLLAETRDRRTVFGMAGARALPDTAWS